MAKRLRIAGGLVLLGCGIAGTIASCSSPGEPERTGQSAAGLSPLTDAGEGGSFGPLTPLTSLGSGTNYRVTGPWYGVQETTIAVAKHTNGAGGLSPNWVIGWNYGWSVSSDLNADTWDAQRITTAAPFGDPCGGGHCMSDDGSFAATQGDPSLATVLQPDANESPSSDRTTIGKRVLFTHLAQSTSNGNPVTDVMVSLSRNGGQTFGDSFLLTQGDAQDGGTGGGVTGQVDNPVIASHHAAPHSTYAAWTVGAGTFNAGFITQVLYDASGNLITSLLTPPLKAKIPYSPGHGYIFHPAIALGQLPRCDGSGITDEIVYVAWADTTINGVPGAGCVQGYGPGSPGPYDVNWYFATFDPANSGGANHGWWGPYLIDHDDAWPGCVGASNDAGFPADASWTQQYDNDVRPRIATEPQSNLLWIVYNKHESHYGTQILFNQQALVCSGGTWVQDTGGPAPVTPHVKCWAANGCNNSCDPPCNNMTRDGYTRNDQWGPAIAFQKNDTTGDRELVPTWYDTRDDVDNTNVTIYGAYEAEPTINVSNLGLLTHTFKVGTGTGTPWNHTIASWPDYQAIESEPINYTFLGAWGGDGRKGAAEAGVWSAVIQ